MNFKIIESKKAFKGKILDIRQDRIEFENGLQADRELVEKHHEAAVVIALDEEGKLIFVKQYRYGTSTEMLELPAGLKEAQESDEGCARRELEEETGLRAGKLTKLFDYYASPGYCTEKVVFFLAQQLTACEQKLDADEFLTIHRYTVDEAVQMISQGKITNGMTIAGIFAVKARFKMD